MAKNSENEINSELELIIHPTEACNFRCRYCYENFNIDKMKPNTVNALKLFLNQRVPELNNILIQWFGGEPLVGYNIVTDVMKHISSIKEKQNNGLNITSYMTTNAYLLNKERLTELVGLGVSNYQISFDGDREEHNKLRVTAAGKGTFDTIWDNLSQARSTDLNFIMTLRVHANKENEASIGNLLRKVRKEFGGDERFVLFIRGLSRLGGKNDQTLPIIEDNRPIKRLRELARDMGIRTQEVDDTYICYAAKPNSFVIRADGSVSKCTVALYSDFNIVGALNIDGTLSLDSKKITPWVRGLFNGSKEDLACPLKGFPKTEAVKILRTENAIDLQMLPKIINKVRT